MLKRATSMRLSDESGKLFVSEEYQPINLELITLQCVLSKILQNVMTLKAANVMFKDIVNYNRKRFPVEI